MQFGDNVQHLIPFGVINLSLPFSLSFNLYQLIEDAAIDWLVAVTDFCHVFHLPYDIFFGFGRFQHDLILILL
jgi:hypothetical protein